MVDGSSGISSSGEKKKLASLLRNGVLIAVFIALVLSVGVVWFALSGAVQESANAAQRVTVTMVVVVAVCAIIFVVLSFVITRLSRRLVLDDLNKTNSALEQIAEGDYSARAQADTTQEFMVLSNNINTTVDALRGHLAATETRVECELEVARSIQKGALPRLFRDNETYALFASMDAALEIGGDFYDFYPVAVTKMAICVCDVSGKGIPAALFMMGSKALLKGYTEKDIPMGSVLHEVNNRLCEGNSGEMFVTAWYGVFDPSNGHIQYGVAGHNPPVLLRADGTCEFVRVRPGLALGAMEDMPYKTYELDLKPGEALFLYTDGVTEATDANDELFGDDRLLAILRAAKAQNVPARELCDFVRADIDAFVGQAPQFDDITMLYLEYRGGES